MGAYRGEELGGDAAGREDGAVLLRLALLERDVRGVRMEPAARASDAELSTPTRRLVSGLELSVVATYLS